jgi:hypothetical protein
MFATISMRNSNQHMFTVHYHFYIASGVFSVGKQYISSVIYLAHCWLLMVVQQFPDVGFLIELRVLFLSWPERSSLSTYLSFTDAGASEMKPGKITLVESVCLLA